MIQFAFAIVILFVIFLPRSSIKIEAEALEDTSHIYLEGVPMDNSIERQEQVKEFDKRLAKMGITELVTHDDIMKKLGRS